MRHELANGARLFERRRFVVVGRLDDLDTEKGDEYPSQNP